MLSKPNQPKNRNFVVISEMNDTMQSTTNSRKIAKKFGKQHKSVTRAIKNLVELKPELGKHHFAPTSYFDKQNKEQLEYVISKDGFVLLVMSFTGEKALEFKLWYIDRFNDMAKYIKENEIYRISVDSRNKMNGVIKTSGLLDIYGSTVYEQIARELNKLVFNSVTYPNYLKVLAKKSKYKSIRDMIRNDLDREERMMKFLEDYLYNSLKIFNMDIEELQAKRVMKGLKSLSSVIQNF